jgi:hypothetical protein
LADIAEAAFEARRGEDFRDPGAVPAPAANREGPISAALKVLEVRVFGGGSAAGTSGCRDARSEMVREIPVREQISSDGRLPGVPAHAKRPERPLDIRRPVPLHRDFASHNYDARCGEPIREIKHAASDGLVASDFYGCRDKQRIPERPGIPEGECFRECGEVSRGS